MVQSKVPYIVIALIALLIIIKLLLSSLFFKSRDRVNFVIFDQNPVYYSLGLRDGVDYMIPFYADLKIVVPGGYSFYRVGAIARLAELEKKGDLFKRAFSLATSTFTELYFYPGRNEVFYGKNDDNDLVLPDLYKVLIYRSNGNLFDRLYLLVKLIGKNKNSFQKLVNIPTTGDKNEPIFAQNEFFKKYQGYFYQRTYREENKSVQIIYTKSYKSALNLSDILDGSGIKVVDLSEDEKASACRIIEDTRGNFSQTAKDLADFLRCKLTKGSSRVSDIIVVLGTAEGEWE